MFEDIFKMQPFEEDGSGEFMPMAVFEDESLDQDDFTGNTLPLLALKNTVLFPGNVIPITVGRDKSIRAINKAYQEGKSVAVLSQKEVDIEDPQEEDLYRIGVIARIMKLLKMPDGTTTAILQGKKRFRLETLTSLTPYLEAKISNIEELEPKNKLEFEAITATIIDHAKKIIQLSPNIPSEAVVMLKNINNKRLLLNFIAGNTNAKTPLKQQILETNDPFQKAQTILQQLNSELQLLELRDQIESKVRVDIEKQQRDYFLNQQLKTIRK